MATATVAPVRQPATIARSILATGFAIGTLSAIDLSTFFSLTMNRSPLESFQFIGQYVASGLLGTAAFGGGAGTVALGMLLHYGISLVVAALFILAAGWVGVVRRFAVLAGVVYGVAASMVMNTVVVPMSAAAKLPLTVPLLINTFASAILFIGIPVAIAARRNAGAQP